MMKGQKGITLVALVITIIVMLILVGVSITVAMQGGLFDTARGAATGTNEAAQGEKNLAEGSVQYRKDNTPSDGYHTIYDTTVNGIADGTYTTADNTIYNTATNAVETPAGS